MKLSDKISAIVLAACVAWLAARLWPGAIIAPESPIDAPGLAVMVVYDDDATTAGHAVVIDSTRWRERVAEYGGEWLCVDVDDDLSPGPEYWAKAATRPRSALPWLIVGNGKTGAGFEMPLPSLEEMLSTIDRAAGK